MVLHLNQYMATGSKFDERQPQWEVFAEIKGLISEFRGDSLHLRILAMLRKFTDIDDRQIDNLSCTDSLQRLPAIGHLVGRTQNFMPSDDGVDRAMKRVDIQSAVQTER
jgi:hypothetical protein